MGGGGDHRWEGEEEIIDGRGRRSYMGWGGGDHIWEGEEREW